MDHPRLARILDRFWRNQRLLSCIRPCSAVHRPQALMVFADRLPDKWTSCVLASFLGLCRSRSDRFAITLHYPRKPDAPAVGRRFDYTAIVARNRYASCRESIAQTIRAVLWAKAVAATGIGRRASSGVSHGRGRILGRLFAPTTALAPWISRVRKYRWPPLLMCPIRWWSPLDVMRGVRPSQAAKWRPERN